MIEITLLDGSKLSFDKSPTGYEVAYKISPRLADNAFAVYVNNELYDIKRKIINSAKVEIVTNKNTEILLSILRHDMAHLLGEAIMEVFPDSKLGTGPVTENGFFYDCLPSRPFNEEDLIILEERMREIITREEDIIRREISKTEAIALYESQNQDFKVEILKEISSDIVSFYQQGSFDDLCRGPHIDNTKRIPKSFKLTKVSGVYWQGDSKNPMMQRVYGIGFLTQKDLEAFLNLQEELKKHDHRKLGKELDLFHMQEEAVGSVFWHDKGWRLYRKLESYIRKKLEIHGYQEVRTPLVLDKSLWEASGHWDKFGQNMFVINTDSSCLALKPMNCPAHIQIFKQGIKSYKDLPLRMAEFGCCHRNEPSGALHGIMRVISFTQDDAHIFCTEDQIISETISFCNLLKEVYQEIFGEDVNIIVKFSDRPAKRAGNDDIWDKSEKALWDASIKADLEPILNKGEGAFYGPKLEFAIKDSLGRDWQLGTLQSDFVLPSRLGSYYIGEDGEKHIPVMLHRAILGSLERFIGILLEHYKGKLPLWLSPVQVCVLSITNKFDDYAQEIVQKLKDQGVYVDFDSRYQKINYKIREHTLKKIPILIIVGEKEQQNSTVTLRVLGQDKQMTLPINEAVEVISINIEKRNIIFEM